MFFLFTVSSPFIYVITCQIYPEIFWKTDQQVGNQELKT